MGALGIAGGALTRQIFTPKLAAAPNAHLASPQIEESDQPTEKPEPAEPLEKIYQFEMRNKPWGAVLEWLADQTGLPVMTNLKPSGKFTFVGPKSALRYTMGGILDLLNEGLANQKLILIRDHLAIRLAPADEKIDSTLVPRIRVDELPTRGKTQIVLIVLPLDGQKAEGIAPEIKKLMGPFGEVIVLKKLNQLVVQDTVGNLQRIIAAVQGLDSPGALERDRGHKNRLERLEAPKPIEKTYTFKMREQPWTAVLEWLADETGLPFICACKPTGTLTFISPMKNKSYTIGEVFDILNEALAGQKMLLIRRTTSIAVVPADEKIDPAVLPRIQMGELATRGRTELVQIVLPLQGLKAEVVATDIKKILGPWGDVIALKSANQLLLLDAAGNLRRICEIIKEAEAQPALEKAPIQKSH